LTVPDAHPMPRIDDLIDKIGSAKFKTKVDMSRGYWQVPMCSGGSRGGWGMHPPTGGPAYRDFCG